MAVSIVINPATRDIELIENEVHRSAEPISEIILAIGTPLGSYWADPEMGSDVLEVAQQPFPSVDARKAAIEQSARAALARLEGLGYLILDAVEWSDEEELLRIFVDSNPSPIEVGLGR